MCASKVVQNDVPGRIRASGFTDRAPIAPQRDDLTTNRQGPYHVILNVNNNRNGGVSSFRWQCRQCAVAPPALLCTTQSFCCRTSLCCSTPSVWNLRACFSALLFAGSRYRVSRIHLLLTHRLTGVFDCADDATDLYHVLLLATSAIQLKPSNPIILALY